MQGEFGREGAQLWQLANGLDATPLMPRHHEETFVREATFATPTVSLPVIFVVLESLLSRAFTGSLRGRFARVALLEGHVDNGSTWSKRIGFREPVGSCDRADVHTAQPIGQPGLARPIGDPVSYPVRH